MTETAAPPTDVSESAESNATAAGWKGRRDHPGVTLPSGAVVTIRLPNLGLLIKSGEIPNALIDEALEHRNAKEVTRESLEKTWDFARYIVPHTVIDPKITEDDVDDLPIEDIELIAAFAARNTDMDAVGHHLGGLETVQSFRSSRGIVSLDEIVGDLSGE